MLCMPGNMSRVAGKYVTTPVTHSVTYALGVLLAKCLLTKRDRRSVARIVARAESIIAGHGPPFHVDADLLPVLIQRFSCPEYASQYSDVLDALERRSAL
jgi:hypothetical protein